MNAACSYCKSPQVNRTSNCPNCGAPLTQINQGMGELLHGQFFMPALLEDITQRPVQ